MFANRAIKSVNGDAKITNESLKVCKWNTRRIVETDPDKLQKELIRRGDRKGRRFQKLRRV